MIEESRPPVYRSIGGNHGTCLPQPATWCLHATRGPHLGYEAADFHAWGTRKHGESDSPAKGSCGL
jgi:hypothetical protein